MTVDDWTQSFKFGRSNLVEIVAQYDPSGGVARAPHNTSDESVTGEAQVSLNVVPFPPWSDAHSSYGSPPEVE